VLVEEISEAGLDEGNATLVQTGDELAVDVNADEMVAQVGEAGGCHRANMATTDNCDPCSGCHANPRCYNQGRGPFEPIIGLDRMKSTAPGQIGLR
jgi:hypothetical protein